VRAGSDVVRGTKAGSWLDNERWPPYGSIANVKLRNGSLSSFRAGAVFRCLLALVTLFYVAQHVSAVAHFALVRHAVCDEHGELVDVDAVVPAASVSQAARHAELGPQESSSHSGHGHEHCGVLAHLAQQHSPPVFAGILPRVSAVEAVANAACPSVPLVAIPVYLLAPKNSPPA